MRCSPRATTRPSSPMSSAIMPSSGWRSRSPYLQGQRRKACSAQNVTRLDLDYAREQVSVLLAQLGEGRATQQQVDDARLNEQEKWIVFYEAQHGVEKARLALLRQTGTLLA